MNGTPLKGRREAGSRLSMPLLLLLFFWMPLGAYVLGLVKDGVVVAAWMASGILLFVLSGVKY